MDNLKHQAHALFDAGRFAEAAELFQQILSVGDTAEANYNLGTTLGKLDQLEEAIACMMQTINLNPSFTDAYINLGIYLTSLNKVERARTGFAIARQTAPDSPAPVLYEALAALTLGDYPSGWRDFAARWQLPAFMPFKKDFAKPAWSGEDLDGKKLFIFSEQGFGDTIQMARFLPGLNTTTGKIFLELPSALERLFETLPNSPTILTKYETPPEFDFFCSIMDLPGILGTTVLTIPASIPYLHATDSDVGIYRQRLSRKHRLHVGLCWAGRPSHKNDHNRSIPLHKLLPLLIDQDIEWISLQRVMPEPDQRPFLSTRILDWGANFEDFADAAAAISVLDLVITVDTSIAHLAGALGKSVWIMLPFSSDWRWLIDREDSPWYPTALLFRQKTRGDWTDVVNAIAHRIGYFKPEPHGSF